MNNGRLSVGKPLIHQRESYFASRVEEEVSKIGKITEIAFLDLVLKIHHFFSCLSLAHL